MHAKNVHPLIARLVLSPEGDLKESMYQALRTTLSIDDALDLLEIDEVGQSWRAAARRNGDAIAEERRRRQEANRAGH